MEYSIGKKLSSLLFTGALISIFAMTSCNNSSKGKKEDKDTTVQKGDTENLAARTFKLHRYKLTKNQLDTLLKDNNAKEIRFSFYQIGKDEYSLRAVAEDGNKNERSEQVDLSVLPNTDTLFSNTANRNDQYLTRGALKGVWGLTAERGRSTRIDPSKYSDIILVPLGKLEPESQSVRFAVFVDGVQILITAGTTITNPSPPAKPCEEYEGCDL
jgi:hypothetical protein